MSVAVLRTKYRLKWYWGQFMEFFGYCRHCGMKMSRTATGRQICTNINCRLLEATETLNQRERKGLINNRRVTGRS